jgi:competence protein ComEA
MTYLKGCIVLCLLGVIGFISPVNAATEVSAKTSIDTTITVNESVNINTATAELLALKLTGIGIKRAQAIVEYRRDNGLFQSAEQLQSIKGISAAIVEKNLDRIRF